MKFAALPLAFALGLLFGAGLGCGRAPLVPDNDGLAPDLGPPSCANLPATCGPAADESCCTSLFVPGGTYDRSNDARYPATVSDFKLDKYEITIGRFRAFVNAGKGTRAHPPARNDGAHPLIPGSGWDSSWNGELAADIRALTAALKCDEKGQSWTYQTWTDVAGGNENRPLNCMTWYEAFAFCAWDGGRLPTEAEWNYAAAGGSEQRQYAWGNAAPDSSKASYYEKHNCVGDGLPGCAVTDLVFVGTKPAGNGKWGHADLAGNVTEWNLDVHHSTYDPSISRQDGYPVPCVNCARLAPAFSSFRVLRGGGFNLIIMQLGSGYRDCYDPGYRWSSFGARCARRAP